jgi:hypothetical protein
VLTLAFYLIVALVVGVAVFYVVALVFGNASELVEVDPDDRPNRLHIPAPISSAELMHLQLPVSVRGYRMSDTDQLLDRLSDELADREQEIVDLREQLSRAASPTQQSDPAVSAPAADPADSWAADRTR